MASISASCRASADPVHVRHLGTVDYSPTWELQRQLADARAEQTGPDTLLLLQHNAVYTAGRRTEPADLPADGAEVINVDRGGKLTWHGPGQLVGYPIVGLAEPIDVVHYVRRVEQALISVCDKLGIPVVGRVEGRSGVWLPADETRPERKIAAIGIRVQRGVTMHGFSINCDCDLGPFQNGVACGIRDAGITSLTAELGRDVSVAEVTALAETAVIAALNGELPVSDRFIPRKAPSAPGITFALSS